jgi:hypothetical protein
MRRSLLTLLVVSVAATAFAGGGFLRPPSYPLVAHDPYFSIWSPSEKFASTWPTHWTGHVNALTSMARIDGKVVRLLGMAPAEVPAMTQAGVDVYALRTLATYADGAVVLNLSFITPALPDDLDLASRPITYITWDVRAVDGKPHDVSVYFDTSAELCVNTPDQIVEWGREDIEGLDVMRVGSKEQAVLQKSGDDLRIDWGHAYVAVPKAADTHTVIASDVEARSAFAQGRALPAADDKGTPRAANDHWPVLAVTLDFGRITNAPTTKRVMLGYDDEWSIRWMGQKLRPYWRRNGATMKDALVSADKSYEDLQARTYAFDREFMKDLTTQGGVQYARMGSLAYRQCFAGNKLVADANGRPLLFPKENFSNGCIGTVDVIYPMSPLFLWTSADLAKAMLVPVLEYASSPRWKFPFAPHDLGTYPHADGQVYGGGEKTEENQMPVEESANMLLMLGALAEIEGNADFAAKYWPALSKWAAYLESKGLDPENQLCTDDFSGHLAHNVNLSCKAILALGAYSKLCALREMKDDAARWRKLAEEYAAKWTTMAVDGDHTKLAFDQSGTWSQKYNLAWDRVLGLGLFSDEVKAREMAFYRAHQQKYGLPLDSRATYTKLDWVTWTATITGKRDDFIALIQPAYNFLDETPDRVPMSDWYETKDARKVGFIARPVVGGVFMQMLGDRALWKKWFARGAHGDGAWAAMPGKEK